MTPERWQRIESIYHSALQREPDTRNAFLAGACQGDEELRRELESLLDQQGSVLEQAAWQRATSLLGSTVTQFAAGSQLGPYRIES
jgi:hypothetical protein